MKMDIDQRKLAKVSSLLFIFFQKMLGSRKIMKIQGKLEGTINESRIEWLAGMALLFTEFAKCDLYIQD